MRGGQRKRERKKLRETNRMRSKEGKEKSGKEVHGVSETEKMEE